MKVEVYLDEYLGNVIADLKVVAVELKDRIRTEMHKSLKHPFPFPQCLVIRQRRSNTQGRAVYSMRFSRYEECRNKLLKQ